MSTPIPLLRAAHSRLKVPGQWTSGTLARNLEGRPVPYLASTAVSWSLQAALCVESHRGGFVTACRYLAMLTGNRSLQSFNDREGHKAVLDLLESAIEMAERKYGLESPLEMDTEYHNGNN